jgi:hypothetical protein
MKEKKFFRLSEVTLPLDELKLEENEFLAIKGGQTEGNRSGRNCHCECNTSDNSGSGRNCNCNCGGGSSLDIR